jgi:hypothetical protein
MKKIHFEAKRPSQPGTGTIDDWVLDREPASREAMKRLTIDVPLSLHKRVKSRCALENLIMADIVRELLEQRFPRFESEPSGEAS